MEQFTALVNQVGPALALIIVIIFAFVGSFWLQSRSLNAVVSSVSEIARTSTVELRERNDRIGTLEASLLAEREINHQKTLRIVELEGVLSTTMNTLGHREFELSEAREANSALKAAKDELRVQFATLSDDVREVTSRLEIAEAKLSEAGEHINRLEEQQATMQAELEEAKRLREEAERINRDLIEERDRLVTENSELTRQVAQYKEEVQALRGKLDELEKRVERMIDVQESNADTDAVGGAGDDAGADGGGGAG